MHLLAASILLAEILLGSWNMKWFPSGRAEHRASERVEQANYEDAAELIRSGLGKAGSHHILFLQEIREARCASNLVAAIGMTNLTVASCSAFRTMRDNRLDWQQCAILSDLPVVESGWDYWKSKTPPKDRPPRGYAYAVLDAGKDGLIACWCTHLKSNYGATNDEKRRSNAAKRERSAAELVALARKAEKCGRREIDRHVIAGDFNTDPFSRQGAGERTVSLLADAGFANCFAGLPLSERGTHPGNTRYPDSTIDFFFHRGFSQAQKPTLSPCIPLSDHKMIWMRIEP